VAAGVNIATVNKMPSPCPAITRRTSRGVLTQAAPAALSLVLAGCAGLACGQTVGHAGALPADVVQQAQQLAAQAASNAWGSAVQPRIEVVLGKLDPRLNLAPCQKIEPYWPANARALGHTRLGLRCTQGATHWNVSLPVDIRLWAPSLVARSALPAGTVLEVRHLSSADVDLAERVDPAIALASMVVGRTLARGLAAGDAVRKNDLKARQWFNAGDMVRIVAGGPGYAISSEGQAMGPGLEGQAVRVRTEAGRIITGVATGDRQIEVAL
jgi:flagella basal body P-ring formation protein FlgA